MLGRWREGHGRKMPRRVLVVEDDGLLALAIEVALLDAGARQVVICTTADAALHALESARPDAIVLDVHLADRDDGWALAELVSALGPPQPRIVFSTGTPEAIPARIADMGQVFAKPYNPADLAEALASEHRGGLMSRLRGVPG